MTEIPTENIPAGAANAGSANADTANDGSANAKEAKPGTAKDAKPGAAKASKTSDADRFPRWLLWLLIFFALFMMSWQVYCSGSMGNVGDTYTYEKAWEVLKTLHPDICRPPVFPILLGVCYSIFGVWWGQVAVCAIQWGCWIWGLTLVWQILSYLKVKRNWRIGLVLICLPFYGCWVMNNAVQTDGFATGLIPLVVWELIRYRRTGARKWIWWALVTLLGFLFLKPQFLFLIPVMTVSWLYVTWRNRRHRMESLAIPGVSILLLYIYYLCVTHCYPIHSISNVTNWNGYNSMRMAGLIKPEEIRDSVTRETLRPFLEADPGLNLPDHRLYWNEMFYLWYDDLEQVWQDAYKLHRKEANAYFLGHFRQSWNMKISLNVGKAHPLKTRQDSIFLSLMNDNGEAPGDLIVNSDMFYRDRAERGAFLVPLYDIATMPFWAAWLIIFSFSAIWIGRWIRFRRFPVIPFTLAAITVCGYCTAIIGAYGDWGRLVSPYDFPLLIMGADVLYILYYTPRRLLAGRRKGDL